MSHKKKKIFRKLFDVPPCNIKAKTSACLSRADQHIRKVMRNIRPRKKSPALWLQGNVNLPFCWASDYTRTVEKCHYCVLHCLCSSLVTTACLKQIFNNIQVIKQKIQKISLTHVSVWYVTIFLDTLHSQCADWWYKLVVCSTAGHGKSLCTYTQLPTHWKKLDLCKVFNDTKVQSKTCLWQPRWAGKACCSPKPPVCTLAIPQQPWRTPALVGRQGGSSAPDNPNKGPPNKGGQDCSVLWIAWR